MPVQVSQLPNEHILLCVYSDPLDVGDLRQIETQSVTLAAAWEGPVFRIGDIRNLNISFGDLVVTLADASKSGNPGSLADPKFKDIVVVVPGTLAALGALSMGQKQYGAVNIPMFESLDEALAHARGR
jgi:hypothetical protein